MSFTASLVLVGFIAVGIAGAVIVDEADGRAGDVIELYVWGGPAKYPVQLVDLSEETPAQLNSQWQISAPLDPGLLSQMTNSSYCNNALQSTHAFMAAGSADG
jgi:hypothetical protein